jgi:branched-subunit amino acid aminotransferase/4-amino-4-deoxychorismate lyase
MMEEAFLCSSVRGPLPITRIEGVKIGGGKVGPVFRRLRELYNLECTADALKRKSGKS